MDFIDFEQFLHRTSLTAQPQLAPLATLAVAEPDPHFVPPSLAEIEAQAAKPSGFATLVSARGAAGKTMLAHQLSARSGTPLWSLEADKAVSGDALAARLSSYLGSSNPLTAVSQGNFRSLIIDSLDEARIRVTSQSWEEFLASLAEYAKAGLHLVLLGRRRTIENVWVELGELGVTTALYEVSHFGSAQQSQYVDVKALDGASPSPEYSRARDAVLKNLRGDGDVELGDTFVGYPPVLDAVARLVGLRANHHAVAQHFSEAAPTDRRIEVLEDILQALLQRDQQKATPLAEDLELAPASTYPPEEQLDWLAHKLLGAPRPSLDACPPESRQQYTEQIQGFIADHPFVSDGDWASPVFAAYVGAQRFESAEEQPLVSIGHASGLLFDFLVSRKTFGAIDITEPQLAGIQASVLAGQWLQTESTVSISADGPSPDLSSVVASFSVVDGDGSVRTVGARVLLSTTSELNIVGPLVATDIDFPGRLVIRSGSGNSISLGPDVFIRAREIHLQALEVHVERQDDGLDESGVEIHAMDRFEPGDAVLGRVPESALSIAVPFGHSLAYPWVKYRAELDDIDRGIDLRARRFLDKLMNLARKHGHDGERAVFVKKLQGRQNLRGEDFATALNVLQAQNVAYMTGDLLFIREEWDKYRYDGKGRPGMTSYDDHRDKWEPVLALITAALT